jgi:hypothetical protein
MAIAILEHIKTHETQLQHDLLLCAVRYARLRTDWRLAVVHERPAMDSARTAAHNALIDALNILSRAMVKAGENAMWRKQVGDDRQEIGDWACHVHAQPAGSMICHVWLSGNPRGRILHALRTGTDEIEGGGACRQGRFYRYVFVEI